MYPYFLISSTGPLAERSFIASNFCGPVVRVRSDCVVRQMTIASISPRATVPSALRMIFMGGTATARATLLRIIAVQVC